MSLTFNIGGRIVTADELRANAPKAKPRTTTEGLKTVDDRASAKESMGFIVDGYSPEEWDSRIGVYKLAVEAVKQGGKNPGTLEEFTAKWMRHNKPTKARSKPYELEEAADTCAEMLRRAGWVHVRVTERLRG